MSVGSKAKVLVAMSGGVDSSVAALLALRMGYDCTGVTMKLISDRTGSEGANPGGDSLKCVNGTGGGPGNADGSDSGPGNADADRSDSVPGGADAAEQVSAALGIPHLTIDLTGEFREHVIEPFVSEYEAGATPNPCVWCNNRIKFGLLYEYALEKGFDILATGHYARILQGPGGEYRLARATDAARDQSYFLHGIKKESLAHIIFPLGGISKAEVRALAAEAGFANAQAEESQDICFVREGGHAGFIRDYRGKAALPGNFVDAAGKVLGRHNGVARYTIGQRKKLGIALGRPVFVKEIRSETNEVVLADEGEVYADRIEIAGFNWLIDTVANTVDNTGENTGANTSPGENVRRINALRASIMIRYRAAPAWATIEINADGSLSAVFDKPVRAPAKGQAAVLYDGDLVIGGGRIR